MASGSIMLLAVAAGLRGEVVYTVLAVGGIGVGNAVAGYVTSKTRAIATLKCVPSSPS